LNKLSVWVVLFFAGLFSNLVAADWPQFQGPNRDSKSAEKGLLKEWPTAGPQLLWTIKDCGLGYSSPAIVNNTVYICGLRGDQEFLLCFDGQNGKELWKCPIGPKFDFEGNSWGAGPRATPTISGDYVLALGGGGNLICSDRNSGKLLWSKHMMKDLGGEVNPIGGGPGSKQGEAKIGWGYSWSPLVDNNRVVCFPGGPQGALAVLDLKTGDPVWRSKEFTAQASYSSPIVAEVEGVRQFIVLHNGGVSGIAASDGKLLWNWEKEFPDVAIPTPLYTKGHVYATACGTCGLIKLTKSGDVFTAEPLYKGKATRVMKCQVGGPVIVDEHVYGYSDKLGWVCQKLLSGDQAWVARAGNPLKAGSVVAADGLLVCYDEDNAEVALLEADPTKFSLKSKFALPQTTAFKASGGRNWTPPVIDNGQLFIRDQELLFCFKIK
jgi:outer membrane protein assembly factor BamB